MKKKLISITQVLAALAIFITSAEAAIKIEQATVQNDVAYIQGNGAALGSQITWEGKAVTTANKKNGGFSFMSVLPADCTGALSDGYTKVDVAVLGCTPVGPALVPNTGQKTSYDTNNPQRDDGALQKGVAWPDPRFTKNVNADQDDGLGGGIAGNGICDGTEVCNGTITDHLTGLIWLANANCANALRNWQTALSDVVSLNTTGTMNGNGCGDSSNAGGFQNDWRLPNRNELASLLDLGHAYPALPTGHSFTNFQAAIYWSSTTFAGSSIEACVVNFYEGVIAWIAKGVNFNFVIAVRGGS